MKAAEYLKENSDWFDKSPAGEKLYFESEVIRMMENYSSQTEISDEEIDKAADNCANKWIDGKEAYYGFVEGATWYREQLKLKP